MKHDSKLPDNPNEGIDYSKKSLHSIWFAGGCFWGVEAYMRRVLGVAKTSVGYANGKSENPSYEDVCTGKTGHAETVYILYDPEVVTLEKLLQEFFIIIDPTSFNRQGNDTGSEYRTGIYYKHIADEETIREFISKQQEKTSKPILTEIKPLYSYSLAEEYHQSYLEKNPNGYCHIDLSRVHRS